MGEGWDGMGWDGAGGGVGTRGVRLEPRGEAEICFGSGGGGCTFDEGLLMPSLDFCQIAIIILLFI